MMPSTLRMYLKLLVGAIVALTPPALVYLQGRSEMREKYREANSDADAGYKTLVDSVRELRVTVSASHDQLVRLQAQLDLLQSLSPLGSRPRDWVRVESPKFRDLPANLDAAQMKR